MSGVNTNTDTSSAGASGEPAAGGTNGQGTTSFDELDALTSNDGGSSRYEDKDTPRIKRRGGADDEAADDGEKKSKSKASKEKNTDESADDDKSQDKKVAAEKDGKEKTAEEKAKIAKAIKLKNGDADLEVPADAKVTVKIGGKDEEFTVQELLNEFSGKTDWSRKYTALDTERKTFQAERQELQTGINSLFELAVTQSKPLDAIQMLTEMLGGDGVKQVTELRSRMLKEFEEYAKLSPEDKKIQEANERAELLEARERRRQDAEKRKSEETKFVERIQAVKTKHKMDDGRYEEIETALKKAGNIPKEDLTPELIGAVNDRWIQMDSVDEIVSDLGFEGDKLTEVKNALLNEWQRDRELTKDQVKKIAQAVFGGKSKGKSPMQKKLERNHGSVNTDTNTSRRKIEEPITFDDLD